MAHQIQPGVVLLVGSGSLARHPCISVKDLLAGLVIIKAILIVSYTRKWRKQKRIITLKGKTVYNIEGKVWNQAN